MQAAVLQSDRNNRKSLGIPDREISPIYLGVTTNTETGRRVCTNMVSMTKIASVRGGRWLTANRKYVLGLGSGKWISPYSCLREHTLSGLVHLCTKHKARRFQSSSWYSQTLPNDLVRAPLLSPSEAICHLLYNFLIVLHTVTHEVIITFHIWKVSDQSLVLLWKYFLDHSPFWIVAHHWILTKQSLHWTTGYPIGTCLDQRTQVQNTFVCHSVIQWN